MNERYDVLVIGAGSGGVACATALAQAGKRVAIVERERVGGECAYWACVPSKVLLRAADPNAQSAHVPGSREARSGDPDFAAAAAWRTSMVDDYNDSEHAANVRENGVALLRGKATILKRGRVQIGERTIDAKTLVIATGSEDVEPPIEGLAGRPYWTSRDATAAGSVPERLIFLGGGAVGVELAQAFARFGSHVTIIEAAQQMLPQDEPAVGAMAQALLTRDGVTALVATKAHSVAWRDGGVVVDCGEGKTVTGTHLCVATGRKPRVRGFGLDTTDVRVDADGSLVIDDRCCASDGIYAVGDVTGKAPFTHVAKYQGRIAAAAILGDDVRARYDAIPRCIYTSPEIATIGMTHEAASAAGIDVARGHVDFHEITRPAIYCDEEAMGAISLVADRTRGVIVGGWIAAPGASEMIAFLTTAIRAAIPIAVLLDVVQPYPTFSEGFYVALDRVARA